MQSAWFRRAAAPARAAASCVALAFFGSTSVVGGDAPKGPANLLRNGSFEGGLLYWHGVEPDKHFLDKGAGKTGEYAFRIRSGYVMSAPFECTPGKDYTVGFWVKAEKPGRVKVQMPPSAREIGVQHKRLWTDDATQSAEVGPQWKRVSFTWKADVPTDGFWNRPNYLVQLGGGGDSMLFDGATVVEGKADPGDYVPRRAVETTVECTNLPGFLGAAGNTFASEETPTVAVHLHNPGAKPQTVVLRRQWFDYAGEKPLAPPQDQTAVLAPGATETLSAPMKFVRKGCAVARAAVLIDGKVVDSSDLPITNMPYPKSATKPDYRERFGGSFAGGLGCTQKFQRIGFGWIRWSPHSNGEDHLPTAPKPGEPWKWTWFDDVLDRQEALGCSSHLVLYPPPKWIMEPGHPLPKDMRWKADDPKWRDLSIETTWDKFVKGAVEHYKNRSVIFEIENEPEFDHWIDHKLGGEYAQFTIRTARLIKQTAPKAQVMVNNVYGIPSEVTGHLFRAKDGLKDVDVVSWHDYHAGRLTDFKGIQRMRQNLDEAGGKHVEIWFNEGWAFTNTAVDEPPACTGMTSAESTDAILASVAEMTIAGQEKTVLFHTSYEDHGMSFWDYSGPGTLLWDWYGNPLPLVAGWNVLSHHIGISDEVAFVRPPKANFAVFQDLRNKRGVAVAYADAGVKEDVVVELPPALTGLTVEDAMGNAQPLAGRKLTLPKSGAVVYLYDAQATAGAKLAAALEPLDRKHLGFVAATGDGAPSWSLPATWEGKEKGKSEGSTASAAGKPVWKLEQIWPTDPKRTANYRAMVWTGTDWNVASDGMGGQPGAQLKDGVLSIATRAAHGQPMAPRWAALAFVAPQAGTYRLHGAAAARIWDGTNKTQLMFYRKSGDSATKVAARTVPHGGSASLDDLQFELAAGDELVLSPQIEGAFAGGDLKLSDFRITLGGAAGDGKAVADLYRLPAVWDGTEKGASLGNPIRAGGKPLWRLDQLLPKADRILPASYTPMVWNGVRWDVASGGQGGQPSATVADGVFELGLRGPWNGPGVDHPKTAALVFIAPQAGVYRFQAKVSAKKWEGGAESYPFVVAKRDAQRVSDVKSLELPSGGEAVPLSVEVDLSVGHEVVLLPLCPHFHNGATVRIEDLTVRRAP